MRPYVLRLWDEPERRIAECAARSNPVSCYSVIRSLPDLNPLALINLPMYFRGLILVHEVGTE